MAEPPKHPYEDKYLDLRDENIALKRKKNEQEETIKRMYTKLAMIEETLKRKDKEQTPEADSPQKGPGWKRDIETEKFIDELRRENATLRRRTQAMTESTRLKKEKEKQRAALTQMKRKSPRAGSAKVQVRSPTKSSNNNALLERYSTQARDMHISAKTKDIPLEAALKARLVTAERQVVKLQSENDQLRVSRTDSNNNQTHEVSQEVEHLQRELRDRQAQLVILNARYDNLESKAIAEREIQEKTLEQMDNFNRVIHRLRSELQESSLVREELEKKAAKAKDMRQELQLLREQNHKLEERMTSLCESPFINDAFQRKERIDKLVNLESLTKQQQAKIESMELDAQKQAATIQELHHNIRLMKQAKEAVDKELLRVRQLLDEERMREPNQQVVYQPAPQQQLPPQRAPSPKRYSSHKSTSPLHISIPAPEREPDIPPEIETVPPPTFRSALPVVTRRINDPTFVPFLESTDNTSRENSVSFLRNKVHTLQIAHLTSTQELERCEKMLQAQTSINRELTFEIEELITRQDSAHSTLRKKMDEMELLAEQRLRKVAQLEAQLRQLKYMKIKAAKGSTPLDESLSLFDEDDIEILPDEDTNTAPLSIDMDLAAGENIIEIWIVGAQFDTKFVNGNGCTFILCDFFDFESQSTALQMGNTPKYNFAATYKITADAFFLRYLASERLALEVHQAIKGDFQVVAKTALRMDELLHSRGKLKNAAVPIHHVATNAIIGSLDVVIRLAIPLTEIWQLHLQSCPADRAFIAHAPAVVPLDASDDIDQGPLNDLEISIVSCKKLFTVTGTPPSAYVHYQLLGFPDVFTDIVPNTGSPVFTKESSTQVFTLSVDSCLKHFLRRVLLRCTVFDDNHAPDDEIELSPLGPGVLGVCDIPLKPLVLGDSVNGWFDILNPIQTSATPCVGEMLVTIRWKNPFQVMLSQSHTAAQMNALAFSDVHDLMTKFALLGDGRVNYRSFLLFSHASVVAKSLFLEVVASIQTTLHHLAAQGGQEEFSLPKKSYSKDELISTCKHRGLLLGPDQIQILFETLGDLNGYINTSELWLHIHPTPPCQARLIAQKCRDTLRKFELREQDPTKVLQPFNRYDPAQTYYVSRAEFKRGLSVLGFHLYDPQEEEAKQALLQGETEKIKTADVSQTDVVTDDKDVFDEIRPKQSPATEFEQRKAVFLQRMKVATEASRQTTFVLDKPSLNAPVSDMRAARVIQQKFRSYRSRMMGPQEINVAATNPPIASSNPVADQLTILDVEKFLADTMDNVDDDTKRSFVQACHDLDTSKIGLITRKQMTFVLNRLCLKPDYLRCLLNTFRTESKHISYAPMIHFIFTSSSSVYERPPMIRLLQAIILQESDFATFCEADIMNGGVLPFTVFAACLRNACPHLSLPQVNLIMQLFDINGFGVEYRAFYHYVSSQPTAMTIQKIKARLANAPHQSLQNIKIALAQLKHEESLTQLQVSNLWKQGNIEMTASEQAILWRFLDKSRLGSIGPVVVLDLFASPKLMRHAAFDTLELHVLQKLAWNARHIIAVDPLTIVRGFTRFDWTKSGVVGVQEFARVLESCGFVFSSAHCIQIARHFYNKRGVAYGPFMQWSHGPSIEYVQLQTRLQKYIQKKAKDESISIATIVNQWTSSFPDAQVSREQFAAVVSQVLHLPLNAEEVRVILNHLDSNFTDIVDIERFMHLDTSKPAPNDEAHIDLTMILTVLQSVMEKLPKEVIKMFEAYDGVKNGIIEEDIFLLVWRKLGVQLEPREVHALFNEFAKEGRLSYRKFFKYGLRNELMAEDLELESCERDQKHRVLLQQYLQSIAQGAPDMYHAWIVGMRSFAKGRSKLPRSKVQKIIQKSIPQDDFIDVEKIGLLLHVFESDDGVSMAEFMSIVSKAAPPKPVGEAAAMESIDLSQSVNVLGALLKRCLELSIDYRRIFEQYDEPWSGLIKPTEIKSSIVELGANMVEHGLECIGHLISAFRDQTSGLVNYVHMIYAARRSLGIPSSPTWHLEESLRLRIRVKCKVDLNSPLPIACTGLTPAFHHFDRSDEGFLTPEALYGGLRALQYEGSPAEFRNLFDSIALFRTPNVLSRVEFDAFVLDSHREDLLHRLTVSLWGTDPPLFGPVSRDLTEADAAQSGVLTTHIFVDVLSRHGISCGGSDIRRLLLLFDVNRTQQVVSYKLFLRVMAQERQKMTHQSDEEETKEESVLSIVYRTLRDYKQGGRTSKELLEAADSMHHGTLTIADFFLTLKHMGLVLAPEQVREIVLRYPGGPDKRQVDYRSLIADAFPADRNIVEVAVAAIHRAAQRGINILERFRRLDKKQEGILTGSEFCQGLDELGVYVKETEIPRLMEAFGPRGHVELRQLIQLAEVYELKALLRQLAPLATSSTIDTKAHADRKLLEGICNGHDIELSPSQWTLLFVQFGDNGMVEMARLVQSIRALSVQDIMTDLCKRIGIVGIAAKDLGEACLVYDREYIGTITSTQFYQAMESVGIPISTSQRAILQYAGWMQEGRVHYREIIPLLFNGSTSTHHVS